MKLSDLRTFLDIIEAGSLTQAALRKGTTQPNLSRALREIERRLDATLVRRDGRGVQLTPAGEVFCAFAEETLQNFQSVRDEISGKGEGLPDTITICVPTRTEHLLLPVLLRVFAEAVPHVTLVVREAVSETAIEDLEARRIDAMLGYLPASSQQVGRVIASEVFYAVGSPLFLGSETAPITMADVLTQPVIAAGPDRYLDLLQKGASEVGQTLQPARFCSAADAMVAFAAEGEGVALLPFSSFQREADRGDVTHRQIIEPTISRSVYLNLRGGLSTMLSTLLERLVLSAVLSICDKTRWDLSVARETVSERKEPV